MTPASSRSPRALQVSSRRSTSTSRPSMAADSSPTRTLAARRPLSVAGSAGRSVRRLGPGAGGTGTSCRRSSGAGRKRRPGGGRPRSRRPRAPRNGSRLLPRVGRDRRRGRRRRVRCGREGTSISAHYRLRRQAPWYWPLLATVHEIEGEGGRRAREETAEADVRTTPGPTVSGTCWLRPRPLATVIQIKRRRTPPPQTRDSMRCRPSPAGDTLVIGGRRVRDGRWVGFARQVDVRSRGLLRRSRARPTGSGMSRARAAGRHTPASTWPRRLRGAAAPGCPGGDQSRDGRPPTGGRGPDHHEIAARLTSLPGRQGFRAAPGQDRQRQPVHLATLLER